MKFCVIITTGDVVMRENTKKVIANIPGLEGYINNHHYGINGINSPIDKNLIPYAINSGIVFEANVADRLYELSKKTQRSDCEYSFILLGKTGKSTLCINIAKETKLITMKLMFQKLMY